MLSYKLDDQTIEAGSALPIVRYSTPSIANKHEGAWAPAIHIGEEALLYYRRPSLTKTTDWAINV